MIVSSSNKPVLLACDDDEVFLLALRHLLKDSFEFKTAKDTDEAKAIMRNSKIDVLLLDINIRREREGLDALPLLRSIDPDATIVMLSGNSEIEYVRTAMRGGAEDFIPKSSQPAEIKVSLERILKNRKASSANKQNVSEIRRSQETVRLVGSSAAIQELNQFIDRLRSKPINVLIHGETGTGKEVVARLLRQEREDGGLCPFISVDSSTITGSLAESILFGHEKGAFTGADQARRGIFEEAQGGIVFLDEIANMTPEIQSKLLRVLQEKEVTRVGSVRPIPVDFRIIAATNRSLSQMVEQNQFKGDLFQRLNVIPLLLPPLRDRKEDIPELVEYFCQKFGQARRFAEDAMNMLQNYSWPGNVRELQNIISYVLTMTDVEEIEVCDLPPQFRDKVRTDAPAAVSTASEKDEGPFYDRVARFEAKLLREAFDASGGNISKLALSLGMDRSHLYSKLKLYGIYSPAVSQRTREQSLRLG